MKIGIIVAMDKEYVQLQEVAQSIDNHDIVLAKCGIGKVNAALGAQKMINEHHPDIIISSGCAGGNGDDINIQDVVVSAELTYHDVYCGKAIDDKTVYGQVQGLPVRYKPDQNLIEKALNLDCGVKVHAGLIVTGDWFVDSKEKMRSIIDLSQSPRLWIWSRVPSHRHAISIRCRLSHSASSATSRYAIQMPHNITTFGTR